MNNDKNPPVEETIDSFDLPPHFNPKEIEDKWYKFWQENHFSKAAPTSRKKPPY